MADTDRSPSPEFSALAFGEDLTPLPEYKAAGTTALNFSGLLGTPIKLHEDLASGCGGQLWPAGMVLAKHMLQYHRNNLGDARILELGAGGGLVGLAVARGCDVHGPVYITDQVEMEALMKHNIKLNGFEGQVKEMVLNWLDDNMPGAASSVFSNLVPFIDRGEPLPREVVEFKPSIILAADCVYFEPAFPLLLQTLGDLLALCPSATIYFCFKKRRRADLHFLAKAKKAFQVTEVEDDDRPTFSREGLFLYTMASKNPSQHES